MLRAAIPVLHVTRSADAAEFYVRALGFAAEFATRADDSRPDPCYMGVVRGGVRLHLSSFPGDAVPGGVVHVLVDDVDELHRELVGRGVTIAMPPTDQTWGNREMYVRDLDGNSLRFVQARRG